MPGWLHSGALRKRGVVRAEGIEPSRPCGLRIFIPLRLSPPRQCGLVVWTIPSPFPVRGLGAARLVSTPSRNHFRAWLGIAISGFPEFEQFCIAGFPDEHSSFLKSVASAGSATPAWLIMYSVYQKAAERTPQPCFDVFGGFFFFGFGLMTLIAAASRLVLMWEA